MNINIQDDNTLFHPYYDNPEKILDYIDFNSKKIALLLDIDGTLADFNVDPLASFIPVGTLDLIRQIQQHITVVAVTGRDFDSAKKMFDSINIPIAALHGLFIYIDDCHQYYKHSQNTLFQQVYHYLKQEIELYPKLSIENKQYAIALHYRKCPELQQKAGLIMQRIKNNFDQLKLVKGKCVYELVWNDVDKGQAIAEISELLNLKNCVPIFIGDDRTDEDGFAYVDKVKGLSIKVGLGSTRANYRLENIDQVVLFLKMLAQKLCDSSHSNTLKKYGEEHV